MKTLGEKHRQNISQGLKTFFKNNKRKPPPPFTPEHRANLSQAIRKAWENPTDKQLAAGTNNLKAYWDANPGIQEANLEKMRALRKDPAIEAKRVAALQGCKMTGACAAFVDNIHAVDDWHFVHKRRGLILKGKNLAQLIRDNESWFTSKDLAMLERHRTLAHIGLSSLKSTAKHNYPKGRAKSWHGWTVP